ncbi:ubiquitin-conjugating enzyme/RWD-like protein [Podospora aff. communis PSN243]|uniref:Ubiquitin-conjugating enzyme/RWD-like protein n=1 Tax=Podospora aff. communis PSN243 TaxID=3040156 RepID=A0AAV9GLF5_9PEZI|nr:ubiquitin-conjugating enzyme/RWD-like protein [Podospora aff. communis PSN243]
MATPKFNSKSPTIRRILREAQELSLSPSPDYTAAPLESDLFEWHFTLRGPPNSAYAAGIYHGRINLPPAYPLKPPSFRFVTPSGRFETNREICLSISGHHEESWQPAWGIRTALVALRSFMETDARGQLGGLETGEEVRRRLAGESGGFRCSGCGGRTNREILEESESKAREMGMGEEVVVPEELKMGFKDEMERERREREKERGSAGDIDEESAELAEGFVQTGPPVAQGQVQPTRTVPLPNPPQRQGQGQQPQGLPRVPVQQLQQQQVRVSNDTAWIDRLIVVVGVLLAAMLLKVFLA